MPCMLHQECCRVNMAGCLIKILTDDANIIESSIANNGELILNHPGPVVESTITAILKSQQIGGSVPS